MNVGRGLSAGRSCKIRVVGAAGILLAELFDGRPLLGQLGRNHQVVLAEPRVLFWGPFALSGSASSSSISAGMSRAVIGLRIGRDRDPEAAQSGGMVALEKQLDDQIIGIVQGCRELKDGRMRTPLAAAQRPAGLRVAVDRGRDGARGWDRSRSPASAARALSACRDAQLRSGRSRRTVPHSRLGPARRGAADRRG